MLNRQMENGVKLFSFSFSFSLVRFFFFFLFFFLSAFFLFLTFSLPFSFFERISSACSRSAYGNTWLEKGAEAARCCLRSGCHRWLSSIPFYPSVATGVCLSVGLNVRRSNHLSTQGYSCVHLSRHPSVCSSASPIIHESILSSIRPSISQSVIVIQPSFYVYNHLFSLLSGHHY